MKNDYTHIAVVLDRSGSMNTIRDATISGFNEFLAQQKRGPGECTVTLVQFDMNGAHRCIDTVIENTPVAWAAPLTSDSYVPRGLTPLYDAVGQTINATGKFLKDKPEHERPAKVIFVIITDGLENCSAEFDHQKVRDMIAHQRARYKWDFLFIGANMDAYAVGASMNIPQTHSINYTANAIGTQSLYSSVGSNIRKARSAAAAGDLDSASTVCGFSDNDRDAQDRAK